MGSTGGSRRSASRRGSSSAQSFTHHRQQSTPMPTSSAALASSSTATGPDKDCGSVVFRCTCYLHRNITMHWYYIHLFDFRSVEKFSDPESPRWCRLRLTNVRYEAGPNSSLPETKISLRVTLMPGTKQLEILDFSKSFYWDFLAFRYAQRPALIRTNRQTC